MRHRRAKLAALSTFVAAIATSLLPSPAHASECLSSKGLNGCVDADNLWMNAGATSFFSLGPSVTTPAGRYAFGLGLSYLSRPIGLRVGSASPDGTTVYLVDNAINATFLWSLGVTDRLSLTAAAPLTLFQDGAGLYTVFGGTEELPRSGVRDVRIGFDYAFLAHPRTGTGDGFALLGRFQAALPTGVKDGFAGSRTVTFVPSLLGDLHLGRLTIAGEVGARIRGVTSFADTKIGTQIQGALGASVDIVPKYLTASAEAFVLLGLDDQPPPARLRDDFTQGPMLAPAEWIVSASTAPILGGDLSASIGGGGAIPLADTSAITNPRFRFELGLKYAPKGRDADGDGVLDRDDKCPDVAEDRDGFQDDDGCPELDNDGDRIPDDRDRCRDAAETVDGFQDDDGCPDLDDDNDGIPDDVDQCRNEAEDKDGFKDDDGCPDDDNDGDGIPDKKDLCPNGAEDNDGYKDTDGCPDPDNDGDNILDKDDLCPNAAEDKDSFQDDDGCPDPDNDQDGVLDGADQCPLVAETIDGNDDADGCPEKGAKSLVKWQASQAHLDPPATFARGSAKPSAELDKKLAMLAQLVRGASPVVVIVEGYADRQGDTSAKAADLADKRALAVKAAFVSAGISGDIVQAASGDPSVKRAASASQFDVTVQRPKPKAPKKPAPPQPPAEKRQ
ncbi:MAG: OmpA family protein [Polyangiaceae bacterium]